LLTEFRVFRVVETFHQAFSYLISFRVCRSFIKLITLPIQVRGIISRSYNTTNVAPTVKMFIDGKFVESKTNDWIDLHDPATNEVVTRVPKCTQDEMLAAVESSKRAFKTWSQTSILTRQQVMLKLQNIIRANMSDLAKNITKEQGKTFVDAEGDVLRGLRE
jgi:malonate-semialdehyde dehydrogenase (acetylating) / methylmalonate-semialdehyde dehydrogenase